MEYVWAFVVGGAICVVGQLLIDYTKLTPARILVLFVTLGVVLGALGIYEPLVEFAGAGATVPLTGFGYNMAGPGAAPGRGAGGHPGAGASGSVHRRRNSGRRRDCRGGVLRLFSRHIFKTRR